ncbi:MAG: protein kinase [Anaeromyxobacter sp.]|nr:protein kinase [Anaeromyxobacter sp.]MBL0278095.1 protein kinase [Anaeromyxobacter sp.]
MSTPIGADVVVEVVLKYDRAEWPRLTAELCGGDAGLEALVARLLAHYDRPDAPLPAGPYPVELGPFILERELGAGAHGKVYLARRPPLEGYVAVKLLRPGPGMSEFVEQVRREAGRARRIPSVHVVPVFDAGRIDGGPFYVEMAVCADPDEEAPGSIRIGRSLAEAQVGLGPAEAARLVEDLARAVHAAHRTGVVHGDVKPENVLLTPESRRVMLADFGIATSLAASSSPGSTPIGTVAYMAPEQWRDHLPPSEASDVYTLGGTLYFLLSGLAPHGGREQGADPAPPPLSAGLPVRLREIVERALAPRPEDRPPSAGALAEELRRYRALEPTWHDRRSAGRQALLFSRRHARELLTLAAVLAVVAPLALAAYHVFTSRVVELAAREAALRGQIDGLERAREGLQRETARMEGEASAKQQELGRIEGRLKQLPRLEQALGAAREEATLAREELTRREGEARQAGERAAGLAAQLEVTRDSLVGSEARQGLAQREAGLRAGERDEARRHAAELEARVRLLEERRLGLEREVAERTAALATARAATDREAARAAAAERERDALRGKGPGEKAPARPGP